MMTLFKAEIFRRCVDLTQSDYMYVVSVA